MLAAPSCLQRHLRTLRDSFPVNLFFTKTLFNRSKYLYPGGPSWYVNPTQKFFLEIFYPHIAHETKKNGTISSVSLIVELN